MMYLHYLCIFGLHNDPFEDCKQWKLLKHIPLSDLIQLLGELAGGRSEPFACTVFNLFIYFCLALCFLQRRSHKLFKTPNILKTRFENTFLQRFFFFNFWKNLKISRKIRKSEKSKFHFCFEIFNFSGTCKSLVLLIFSVFQKFQNRKIDVNFYFQNGFSKCWVFWKAYDFYFAKNTTRANNRWVN